MNYQLFYEKAVVKKDLPALDSVMKVRIKSEIEKKLITNPLVFGLALRSPLQGFYKLRVGSYRIVYRVQECTVLIVMIAHRSQIYKNFFKRV